METAEVAEDVETEAWLLHGTNDECTEAGLLVHRLCGCVLCDWINVEISNSLVVVSLDKIV